MFITALKKGTAILAFALLVAIGIPVFGADNATITGDGVRVRTQPSVWQDVRGTLDKGARVQVISRTDYSDTIDGHAAPWYEIVYGDYGGFVFGRYVKLDPGVSVPPLAKDDLYGDPVSRFIMHGLYRFGKGEPDVVKTLGKPVSRAHEKAGGLIIGVTTLTYDGLVIGIRETEDRRTFVYTIVCKTPAYEFETLRVGSSLSDVRGLLGPPQGPGTETVTYYDVSGFHWVTFTLQGGTVVGIDFYEAMAD
jgi:hypothetical protein